MAVLEEKNSEIDRLRADLVAEQIQTRGLECQLRATPVASDPPPVIQALEAEVEKLRQQILLNEEHSRAREKALQDRLDKGEEEYKKSELAAKSAKSAAALAEKDKNEFRDLYMRAEARISEVKDENAELEKRIEIAEKQISEGVELIRKTMEAQIQKMEVDRNKWRDMAMFVMEKDMRTNDEVRRRAGEQPELEKKCKELEGDLENKKVTISDLKRTIARLENELNTEVSDHVFQCRWRLEGSSTQCGVSFAMKEVRCTYISPRSISLISATRTWNSMCKMIT